MPVWSLTQAKEPCTAATLLVATVFFMSTQASRLLRCQASSQLFWFGWGAASTDTWAVLAPILSSRGAGLECQPKPLPLSKGLWRNGSASDPDQKVGSSNLSGLIFLPAKTTPDCMPIGSNPRRAFEQDL